MATIRKRKNLMWAEVAKNDQDSLVDRWLRDQRSASVTSKLVVEQDEGEISTCARSMATRL
jgi:hypothetical protein